MKFNSALNVILIGIALITSLACSRNETIPMGTYKRINKLGDTTGIMMIYPDTDTTALVYIEVTSGAPAHNSGVIYSRMKRTGRHTELRHIDTTYACELQIRKEADVLVVQTNNPDCGFGNGVQADGIFKLTDDSKPQSFTSMTGAEVLFKDVSPENFRQ